VAKNATDEFETRTIGADVVELKEEVVDKLKTHTTGADVVEMEEEVLDEPETQKTKANGVEAEKEALRKSPVKAPQGKDMEAQRENARMVNVHENTAQQEGETSARIETERLEKLRKAKLELLRKKKELLEQLQAANEIPFPTIAAEKMEDKLKSFELDNVLYSAYQKLNPKTRGPKLAGSPGDMVYRPPITPAPGSSLNTTDAKISLPTENPTLKKSNQSLYNKTMQEAQDGFHISSIRSGLPAPSKKPIEDDIRIEVSSSGEIGIDSDLTLQLNADLSHLKSQVSQMQDRLKASFPRIDTLPYDVSETENKKTLQTWLKILAGRWRARYNNADSQENLSVVDAQVRSVMDQMVRDHDLSNAAAKRMTEKWVEVSTRRGVITGDIGGVIDLDELDAGGMSFLNDQDAGEKVDGEQWELEPLPATQSTEFSGPHVPETPLPEHSAAIDDADAVKQDGLDATGMGFSRNDDVNTVSQSNKATASRSPYTSSLQPLSRRAYSTSSRPPPDSPPDPPSPSLPHLTSSGSAHMVSVSAKPHTVRTAIAVGTVYFSNAVPLGLIKSNSLKKGDVLSVSRIAGIMAAKKCPDLIPLCHPIALTHVGVELQVFDAKAEAKDDMGFGGVSIEAKVACTGPTGVEMEALTSVMGCALSVVDMCKAVDKFQRVGDVRVVLKEGGKSGVWREEGWRSFQGQGTE
jgi:molybdenum cofactor biosynthesis protein MoaC